jgi:hypothetical protein
MSELPYRMKMQRNNTAGYVGVSVNVDRGYTGKPLRCYQVSWTESGREKRKRFYWSHYPTQFRALQAACAFRIDRERDMRHNWDLTKGEWAR